MKEEQKTKNQLMQELLELHLLNAEPEETEPMHSRLKRVDKLATDLYRDLVENTNDLIQTITPDGRFLYVNKAWLDALGYTRQDIKHLSIKDIIHPDSLDHCRDIFTQLLNRKDIDKFEAELITKKGRKLSVEVSSHVKFVKGKPFYIQCILRDITERKRIEKALQESEKKYLDLYQNAPQGYHSIGPDGTILEVNNTWLRMFGYEREEVINRMKLTDILNEDGLKNFQKTFPELKEKGSVENVELTVRKKDGSFLPVLISATAVYDAEGNFLKTRTMVRDISARVAYRNMLEQALEEWRITFDSMPYGVLLLDLNFFIRRANKFFYSLYNIPMQSIQDLRCYEIIKSAQLRENYEGLRLRNTISMDFFEYYEAKANKHFLMNLTPIPDADGMTKSFVLSFIDISEIKATEKKLTDSRDAFFNMLKELDFSYKELRGLYEGLIHSFVNAIDAKSPWTKGHSERVTKYAMSIAHEMGLDGDDLETLRIAVLLHDIGKIGTYDIILDNPRKLTPEEIELINLHPVKGEMILKPIKQLQYLLPIIRHHHERIDGQGYPDGLKGEEIPLLSRIICIADAFDSMTSDRPYRSAPPREYAISELKTCSNTQFDASMAEAFLRVLAKI